MWYSEGTVAVGNGSTNIVGTGTSFLTNARVGDGITITGSTALHEIIGIASNTQIAIRPAYDGPTGSGLTYGISPLLGYDKDLSDAFNSLRLQFGEQLSSLQPWAYADTVQEARDSLGASESGNTVFTGTPEQGRVALGASASGESVFTGTPEQGRNALGASSSGSAVFTGSPEEGRGALGVDQLLGDSLDLKVSKGEVGNEEVTTSTGTQTVAEALDSRAISVSLLNYGVTVGSPLDQKAAIQAAFDNERNIAWPSGEIFFTGTIRVYEGTTVLIDKGAVILREGGDYSFCNADAGDTTTTGYNGDGNISFIGPLNFRALGGVGTAAFGMVHAENILIDGQGGGEIVNSTRHSIEMAACKGWKITGYKWVGQQEVSPSDDANLSECIQWDAAIDTGRFPYAPGAPDGTTCEDFTIEDNEFEDVFTAYGAHHSPDAKHINPTIRNNRIIRPKYIAERLRHLKDGSVKGTYIEAPAGRCFELWDSVNVGQDDYHIKDVGGDSYSLLFWRYSDNCVMGANHTIEFADDSGYNCIYEVGTSGTASNDVTVNEGSVTGWTKPDTNKYTDNGNRTSFCTRNSKNSVTHSAHWQTKYRNLFVPSFNAGQYLLLGRADDPNFVILGEFKGRRSSNYSSGHHYCVLRISTCINQDGIRSSMWEQDYSSIENKIAAVVLEYDGETWLALEGSNYTNRAFTNAAYFSGFVSDPDEFLMVTSAEVSDVVPADTGGTKQLSGGLNILGSNVNFGNLPTSSAGLSSGQLWNDGGTVKIV